MLFALSWRVMIYIKFVVIATISVEALSVEKVAVRIYERTILVNIKPCAIIYATRGISLLL